jgi:hypothetical protein
MANKSTFTQEEWNKLLESVMMAGLAITAAEPSGLWGLLKEGWASSWSLVKARTGDNELIKALAQDFATKEGRTAARDRIQQRFAGAKIEDIKSRAIDSLRDAKFLVDAKAGGDAPAFKAWLQAIAQQTADASTEGGFLGFGGVTVSEAEKAALSEIAVALS